MEFSHLDAQGRARMVDVGGKPESARTATARGFVRVSTATTELIRRSGLPKGNPFEIARIAGIQAAKRTADLIPLCHTLHLDFADVQIELTEEGFEVRSEVRCRRSTGVEMEALAAVCVAALTLYDMCKAVDKAIRIDNIHLVQKTKGTA
ncbi:MAG: cyclic pyranopterin monophosphate synthase MoaC [Acidobacteriota bacterium]